MHRRAAAVISLGLLGLLGGSACSGSGGDAAVPADSAEIEDRAAEAAPSAADGMPESAASDVDEFCAAISAIQAAEFELEETFGPEARQLFTEVQAAAPPEIAEEVATVIGALDAVAGLGISMDEDDPAAVDDAFEILLDPDYTDANERLSEYTSEACGIDLGEGDDADFQLDDLEGFDDV
jgi:hypothetical protein